MHLGYRINDLTILIKANAPIPLAELACCYAQSISHVVKFKGTLRCFCHQQEDQNFGKFTSLGCIHRRLTKY